MRKIASHYIWYGRLYRFHYVVVDDHRVVGIYPFEQEEAGIEFVNGLIRIAPEGITFGHWLQNLPPGISSGTNLLDLLAILPEQEEVGKDQKIILWHVPDLSLPASELSTDDGSGHRYIQRL